MALLNLLIGLSLIVFISGAILIVQLLVVVQKCADSLRPSYPPTPELMRQIRYHPQMPLYVKKQLERRVNELPECVRTEYAMAIAAEWDTDDDACIVVKLGTGQIVLDIRPWP